MRGWSAGGDALLDVGSPLGERRQLTARLSQLLEAMSITGM